MRKELPLIDVDDLKLPQDQLFEKYYSPDAKENQRLEKIRKNSVPIYINPYSETGQTTLKRVEIRLTPLKKKKSQITYQRNWTNYNLAQTNEKMLNLEIIHMILPTLDIRTIARKMGAPPLQLRDMIFACLVKVYSDKSLRRNNGELELPRLKMYIEKIPHFNSITNYMNKKSITPYLYEINDKIIKILAPFETILAVDSTGIASASKDKWVKVRLEFKKHQEYHKLHACIGTKTKAIMTMKITEGEANDSPHFKELILKAAINNKIKEVCADPAYFSKKNIEAVASINADPYIKPKSNSVIANGGSPAKGKMMRKWANYNNSFMTHYHQRSLIEAVFSSLKRKFSPYIKSKNQVAQENEILCKIINYNIGILIHASYGLGVNLDDLK